MDLRWPMPVLKQGFLSLNFCMSMVLLWVPSCFLTWDIIAKESDLFEIASHKHGPPLAHACFEARLPVSQFLHEHGITVGTKLLSNLGYHCKRI